LPPSWIRIFHSAPPAIVLPSGSERERERESFTCTQNSRSKCNFVSLRFLDSPDDRKM
jgi:hypothetical protein